MFDILKNLKTLRKIKNLWTIADYVVLYRDDEKIILKKEVTPQIIKLKDPIEEIIND